MVKEENINYHNVNKFVVTFLNNNASDDVVEVWRNKTNLSKLKNVLKKNLKPNHPPRPKSEYIYFCEEVRPIIQQEMKEEAGDAVKKINIHEVTCRLGHRWKLFKQFPDPTMNERIQQLAANDKKRYHEEKAANYQNVKKNNNNHLKSMYLYFCKEERDKNPKINMQNIGRLWGENKNNPKLIERYNMAKQMAAAKV
jgi:hypothetical protein